MSPEAIDDLKSRLSLGGFESLRDSDSKVSEDIVVVMLATPTAKEPRVDRWVALLVLDPYWYDEPSEVIWSHEGRVGVDTDALKKAPTDRIIPRP